MGVFGGIGRGLNQSGKQMLHTIEANFVAAHRNPLFFGEMEQRTRLITGKNRIVGAWNDHRAAKEALGEQLAYHDAHIENLRRDMAAGRKNATEVQTAIDYHNQMRRQLQKEFADNQGTAFGQNLIAGASDMGGAMLDYVTAADRAGGGMRRAGAVAARVGVPLGGVMAAGTAMRYMSGGTFTQNRNGERDIAGIPFI